MMVFFPKYVVALLLFMYKFYNAKEITFIHVIWYLLQFLEWAVLVAHGGLFLIMRSFLCH
jgi:hypothetical protein